VLLEDVRDGSQAAAVTVAGRILEALGQPVRVG
jgi:hypothetical protein